MEEFLRKNPDVRLRLSLFQMEKAARTLSAAFQSFGMAIARAHASCPNLRCDKILIDWDEYTLVVAESLVNGFYFIN